PATIGALNYLQRRCFGVSVAIVATKSGEQMRPDHPAGRLKPDARVQLAPLTAADLAPLAMPDLHESTGGNPRFVTQAIVSGNDGPLADALAEALLARVRAEGSRAYRILLAAS